MLPPPLASRTQALKPSPTLAMTARARAMQADGIDVIGFAAGEPDFNTPEPICEAAIAALHAGFTKYTPTSGIPELRAEVAAKLKRENGVQVEPSQVVVTCGAKQALFNALQAVVDPGDEVVLIAPFWPTYADQVGLAGGVARVVATHPETGFVPSIDDLRAAVGPRTRAILFNSPCNPTGAVFPRQTIKEIAAIALRHGLWVISDEIYEHLVYDGDHVSIASLGTEIAAQTITIVGCSKSYSMTGWRIGFGVGPQEVAKAMGNLQDQSTSNATSFAQKGALAALRLDPAVVRGMRDDFRGRRDLMLERLRAIDGVTAPTPGGAFYVYAKVEPYLGGRFATDAALAEHLLEHAHVATIPGSVFGGPGHLRLSYAASREDIERGIDRIAQALGDIRA